MSDCGCPKPFCKLNQLVLHGGGRGVSDVLATVAFVSISYEITFVWLWGHQADARGLRSSVIPPNDMRGNAWTRAEELKYLDALKTRFIAEQDNRSVGPWLSYTASEFLKLFPLRAAQFDREHIKLV